MNFTKDLHLCGTCKKIFSDLNYFLEHKSQCPSLQNSVVFSPNSNDISLENGLFCNETVLDLTVLDSGSFLPILHCENEEVVSDATDFQPHEEIFQGGSSEKAQDCLENLTADQLSKSVNEKDVANLLVNQLSTGITNNNATNQGPQEPAKSPNSGTISKNINSEKENDKEENSGDKSVYQNQKNVCKICNFVSAYHKDLVRHMRKHTGERPFLCSVCGKKFARQDKLSSHKRIHIGDKRYKCQLCEYATTDSGALKKHSRIHTDERPHRCQMCSYRARNASHMTVHLRTHTGDSPFFCQIESCDKTFKTSTDLKRHLKVHKQDSLSPSYSSFDGGAGKYSCKHVQRSEKIFLKSPNCLICQDVTYRGAVKKKRKGGGLVFCVQPHKCSQCPASFVRQDSLRSHLKQHRQRTTQGGVEQEGSESPKSCPERQTFLLTNSQPQDKANIDGSLL